MRVMTLLLRSERLGVWETNDFGSRVCNMGQLVPVGDSIVRIEGEQ